MTASRPLTDWTDSWEESPAPRRRPARPVVVREQRAVRARPRASATPRRVSGERARRLAHLRALRRDLLIDFVAAFVVMVVILVVSAGLGVVALLEVPLGGAVVASFVIEYRRRRRRL